jgi:hypothetical protein
MLAMLAGCLFVGETVQATKKQPAAYLAQKDFGKKHESVYVLLEQQEPSLAAAFLQATEWMINRNRATKAEKKEMGAFLSLVNKSSLRKDDKKTVRSFIHRATGKWSGGKIAGVAIGSYVALLAIYALYAEKKHGINVFTGLRDAVVNSLSVGDSRLGAPDPAARSAKAVTGNNRRIGNTSFPLHIVPLTAAGRAGAVADVSTGNGPLTLPGRASATVNVVAGPLVAAGAGGAGAAAGSARAPVARTPLVFASCADDSKVIGGIRTFSGVSGELTQENFNDEKFVPSRVRAYNSLYPFLLKKSDLVGRIQTLRSFIMEKRSYVLVILDNASSPIQVYENHDSELGLKEFKELDLEEFKRRLGSIGQAHQLHAVFGNDKIKRLYDEAVAQEHAPETATSSAGAGAGGAGGAGAATGSGGGAGVAGEDGSRRLFAYSGKRVELSPSTFAQGTALGVPELLASHPQYQLVRSFLQSKAALQPSLEGVAVVIRDGTPKVLYSNGTQWFIDGAEPALHTATDTLQVVCGLFGKDAVQKFIAQHCVTSSDV